MTYLPKKSALVAVALASLGVAHAAHITFDDGLDTSQVPFAPLLTHGAPLYQDGFLIGPVSTLPDATDTDLVGALVSGSDVASTCVGLVCPTNDASTFLVGMDDSAVYLSEASDSGKPFTLGSFSASFVGNGIDPLPLTGGAGVLRVLGVHADGTTSFEDFVLAPANDQGQLSFSTYQSSFANTPLVAAIFFAFHCDTQGQCSDAFTNNKAQFALDDIEVSAAVPEPATWGMAALGLAVLGLARRRHRA